MDGIATYSCNCTDDVMGERCEIPTFSLCSSLLCANGGMCISVNSSSYTCTCATGFTGPNCTIQVTPDPNMDPDYTIQLTADPNNYATQLTQDLSDPHHNLTMVIQNRQHLV